MASVLRLVVILVICLGFVFSTFETKKNDSSKHLVRKKRDPGTLLVGLFLILWGAGVGTMATSVANDVAESKRMTRQYCESNCVTLWATWSQCSQPCGGGKMKRTRQQSSPSRCSGVSYTCSMSRMESRSCNEGCLYGQPRRGGGCTCPPGRKAPCCTQRVTCMRPTIPRRGHISTANPAVYESVAVYSCEVGSRLVGVNSRTCLANGTWSGYTPICEVVNCKNLSRLLHGVVYVPHPALYQNVAIYKCDAGYELAGNKERRCLANGAWSGHKPECKGVPCKTLETPQNGNVRISGPAVYETVAFYSCGDGYKLIGNETRQCLANASWSGTQPRCQEIRCGVLGAPNHGRVGPCEDALFGLCFISCDDGYIIGRGSAVRVCADQGEWSGKPAQCQACPSSSYKTDEISCEPCPPNSNTTGPGLSRTSCVCDAGFTGEPGGPCTDINECVNDNGKCDELCINTAGGYRCGCSTPGLAISKHNSAKCIEPGTCRNLTEADAPLNGMLSCHWFAEERSQFCSLRCNEGYVYLEHSNNYETCSESTGYKWTHEIQNMPFLPCVEGSDPRVTVDGDAFYVTNSCSNMTEREREEVEEEFTNMLDRKGVCKRSGNKLCDLKSVHVACGSAFERRKRDLSMVDENKVQLSITLQGTLSADCDVVCTLFRIPPQYCTPQLCARTSKRFLRVATLFGKRQLENLYRSKNATRFFAANRTFESDENEALQVSELNTRCHNGSMLKDDQCAPCAKGMYMDQEANECVACSEGFYQPMESQLECLPCPIGSTSNTRGAFMCTRCTEGHYGEFCNSTCPYCGHGKCDAVSGLCQCHSGWEGINCDTDIPGCSVGGCYPGVTCEDVPAPGLGYHCGDCPPDYEGDGTYCRTLNTQ